MVPRFQSLRTLESVDDESIELLRQLDISNLGDLLAYPPIRHAGLVRAAADRLLRIDEIVDYLDDAHRERAVRELLVAGPDVLRSVDAATAAILARLGVTTVTELAQFPPFLEAEEIITRAVSHDSDPDAPAGLLPTSRKFTRNSKGFASFFKQEEIRDLSVTTPPSTSLLAQLFRFTGSPPEPVVHLGYSVSYVQDWIYGGIHLGEPQGSVSLFMGQDTQVSVLDWRRAVSAVRSEDTQASERLSSTLFHQRAVDEVARATAEEHQYGGTAAAGANAATAGSFVAAGAIVGGVGGGISGALAGIVGGNVANVALGAPTIAGTVAGAAVGSIAGAAAGSLIATGATTLGFVETDAAGDREVVGRSAQNIQQRTVQNSSSLRSFWSNIISQSAQEEQQRIRTDRVTNHNRIHALNALYFEVLNSYRVNIAVTGGDPILFLPFKPFHFTDVVLARYWWVIRTVLSDPALVLDLDKHFLTVTTENSPAEDALAPPPIEEVRTRKIEVELNLDGSAMEDLTVGLLRAAGLSLITGPVLAGAMELLWQIIQAGKREQITVSVLTSAGAFELTRSESPNSNPNFVGRYSTTVPVGVESIEAIEIRNGNAEFSMSVPLTGITIDFNELIFEGVAVSLELEKKTKLKYRKAIGAVELGSLETQQTLSSEPLSVGANRAAAVAWPVADQLRTLVDGVDELVAQLEAELADAELAEARRKNLLAFLNANRFGFTRLILQSVEREQLTAVLETLLIGGVDLSEVAGTTPIGFCGGHVVLPLRNRPAAAAEALTIDTDKLVERLEQFEAVPHGAVATLRDYAGSTAAFLQAFLDATGLPQSSQDTQVLARCREMTGLFAQLQGLARLSAAGQLTDDMQQALPALELALRTQAAALLALIASPTAAKDALARLRGWPVEVAGALKKWVGKLVSSDEVSLPSPAVFMEPVLSQAKGAELYDMRRNSHYEILPAPGIGSADPNVLRAQDPALVPTVPPATLTIQNAPDLPLPGSLTAALAEAGRLDLGALISSNAGTLGTTLSSLSAMATELAKASAQLTGQAQQQALSAAGDVARQVGDLLQSALQTPATAPSQPVPAPPQGQQAKAEVAREVRRANSGDGSTAEKTEEKQTVGAPVTPSGRRDYQMAIVFLDELGSPYPTGEFTLTMTFLETGDSVAFNGGSPIQMADGLYTEPGQRFNLEKGRAATISISADIAGARVSGLHDFTLPDKQDLVFPRVPQLMSVLDTESGG